MLTTSICDQFNLSEGRIDNVKKFTLKVKKEKLFLIQSTCDTLIESGNQKQWRAVMSTSWPEYLNLFNLNTNLIHQNLR